MCCKKLNLFLYLFLIFTTEYSLADDVPQPNPECAAGSGQFIGENGRCCLRSKYNCKLKPFGQRFSDPETGNEIWTKDASVSSITVSDGNGDPIGSTTKSTFTLNHGQMRTINNAKRVFALSTGIGAAGWIPLSSLASAERSIIENNIRTPPATAFSIGLDLMACYKIKSTYPSFYNGDLKVVRNAQTSEEEPDDYLPKKRKVSNAASSDETSAAYMNLAYNVPGNALGGPSVDIFPQGTFFQRLQVQTYEPNGAPSLDVTLYTRLNNTSPYNIVYTDPTTGEPVKMKFIYGRIKTPEGHRNGWMAFDGLVKHSDEPCP